MEKESAPGVQASPEKNNGKNLAVIAVIAIALGGIWLLAESRNAIDQETFSPDPATIGRTDEKIFELSAKPFEFSQKEIRVKKGDTVRINLSMTQGLHDWAVDGFDARTRQLKAGERDSVVFVADKAGTFEYYCTVANHRQMGMVGKLIVE